MLRMRYGDWFQTLFYLLKKASYKIQASNQHFSFNILVDLDSDI